MGYKHIKVSDALTKQQAGQVDGPCFAVMALRDKIKQSVRGLQFIERNKKSLYIYRDDCPYVLGWIGYGDYRQGGDGTEMYVVQARTIVNGKYSEYSKQYFMKMSTNIDTALKSVKTYIRPYNPVDLADMNMKQVSTAISDVSGAVTSKMREIQNNIVDVRSYGDNSQTRLFTELKHLLTTNHEFVDPSFGTALIDYFAAVEEEKQYKGRSVPMWFVRVYERFGAQAFDVLSIDNAENWNPNIGDERYTYNADTLPEDIMGKLSVLNILNDDQYVDDVGYRASEGMFYVVR